MSISTLEIVELDVDLSLEVPCEAPGHDHPADSDARGFPAPRMSVTTS